MNLQAHTYNFIELRTDTGKLKDAKQIVKEDLGRALFSGRN